MPRPQKLSESEINNAITHLTGWTRNGEVIEKTFEFTDFHATMAFVNKVADVANAADHHPEMLVGYSKCKVAFTTHDAKGLTQLDVECARQTDRI